MQPGEIGQLVERRTGKPGAILTPGRFPSAARDFSPGVNFLCRLSFGVRAAPCAVECINICAHVNNPEH